MKENNTIPNIWMAQENLLHLYKLVALGLGVIVVLLMIFTAVISFRDPIVVIKTPTKNDFFSSSRKPVEMSKLDVEDYTKQFLAALYVWSEFNEVSLAKEIAPFTEEGLINKVVGAQTARYGKSLKGKRLEQALAFVKVEVLEDRVTASFLRIIQIEGIPLNVPTEITISMIQGSPTRMNPMGIYVSGIVEHENTK